MRALHTSHRVSSLIMLSAFVMPVAPGSSAAAADLLISGGTIYTGVDEHPRVEALVVRGDRVVFAGSRAQASRRAVDAQPIDLAGGAAYPGFVDAHAHLTGIGLRELTLNLERVNSIESLVT